MNLTRRAALLGSAAASRSTCRCCRTDRMGLARRALLAATFLAPAMPAMAQPGPCPFASSTCQVTPTGGTVPRTEAAIAGDWQNILSLQAQTTPSTDFTSALNAALAGTVPVFLPQTGTPYQVNGTLTFGAGSSLICQPGVQINSVGSSQTFTVANP